MIVPQWAIGREHITLQTLSLLLRHLGRRLSSTRRLTLKYPTSLMTSLVRWKTSRKTGKGTKKLLGVIKAKKILLYTPLIEWYLQQGLRLTAVHQLIECKPGMPFSWFPKKVTNARHEADKDP